jgi:hypothetical protein
LYVYVRNNPLKYTDPTGRHHAECDHDDDYPDSIVVCVEEEIGPYYRHHPWPSGFGPPLVDRGGGAQVSGLPPPPNVGVTPGQEGANAKADATARITMAAMTCDALFAAAGLTRSDVLVTLGRVIPVDGTTSTDTYGGIYGIPPNPHGGIINQTVASAFANGNWPGRSDVLLAWSPFPSPNVYFRPGYLTWDVMVHETLHKFPRMTDTDIAALGPPWSAYNPGGTATGWISAAIAGEC